MNNLAETRRDLAIWLAPASCKSRPRPATGGCWATSNPATLASMNNLAAVRREIEEQ
jgi:hypothetical protein